MATLTGQKISESYKDLLQVSNSNSGIDATLRTVSDGEATDSILKLSTTNARFANINFTGNTISTVAGIDLNITPLAGQQIVLDGTIIIDAGVVTGATSITSTAFVGTLSTAAQTNITSLGTLTTLIVDDITINANAISSGGASSLTITPTTGQKLILDGHWGFDGVAFTAETDNNTTFTAYAGKNITIESVTFDNNVVTATTFSGALSGNASTATILETARTIGGVSFDGSANITVASATGGFAVSGGELDLTGAGALIDINPSDVGSVDIINITPTAVLSTVDAEWMGLKIDASALDPSVSGVDIHGLNIDLSGVSVTNTPHIDGIHLIIPAAGSGLSHHALHIAEGNFLHDFDSGTAAGSVYEVYEITIDASSQDSNSSTHAIDITVEGSLSGTVIGLATGLNVIPIQQTIETFSIPQQSGVNSFAGRYDGSYTAGIDANEIFMADDDEIWIGDTGTFDELQVVMTTPATKDISAEFFYYNTSQAWIEFFPTDGTEGFQQSGNIIWASLGFTNWGATEDPASGSGASGYWMKIVRTRNADPGSPTPATIKLASATTVYSWNASGDVSVNGITATSLSVGAITSTGKFATTLTTEQMRLNYDATNYAHFTVADDGALTITTVDADAALADIILVPDGNVGINTTSPLSSQSGLSGYKTLDIEDTSNGAVLILHGTNGFESSVVTAAGTLIQAGGSSDETENVIKFATEHLASTYTPTVRMTINQLGNVGIGIVNPLSLLHLGTATEETEFVDAGSAAASEQDWIEVEIGGNQGYIRVFAAK